MTALLATLFRRWHLALITICSSVIDLRIRFAEWNLLQLFGICYCWPKRRVPSREDGRSVANAKLSSQT
eukprot:m.10396 g.10396  ORF g.10396 m.10396 type:complete len:69 (+) comp22260_c0_seq1:636-842(+)